MAFWLVLLLFFPVFFLFAFAIDSFLQVKSFTNPWELLKKKRISSIFNQNSIFWKYITVEWLTLKLWGFWWFVLWVRPFSIRGLLLALPWGIAPDWLRGQYGGTLVLCQLYAGQTLCALYYVSCLVKILVRCDPTSNVTLNYIICFKKFHTVPMW